MQSRYCHMPGIADSLGYEAQTDNPLLLCIDAGLDHYRDLDPIAS
jgi:hypothetical protein